MARYQHTEGICLRRLDYSNTSQVATFLTLESGRLSFLAKGATRAPRKGIRTGFDLLERYELVYTTRHSGSLLNLTDRSMLESFAPLRRTLEQTLCAYYAAELVLNFAVDTDPCPRLYAALLEALRRLSAGDRLGLTVLLLELATLREQGQCPTFDECVTCRGKLLGREVFSPADGGPLCKRCAQAVQGSPLTPLLRTAGRHLELLASLATSPCLDIASTEVRPRDVVAAGRILRFHMRYLLGREMRMWKYMQDRHMSKALAGIRSGRVPG